MSPPHQILKEHSEAPLDKGLLVTSGFLKTLEGVRKSISGPSGAPPPPQHWELRLTATSLTPQPLALGVRNSSTLEIIFLSKHRRIVLLKTPRHQADEYLERINLTRAAFVFASLPAPPQGSRCKAQCLVEGNLHRCPRALLLLVAFLSGSFPG